MTPEKLQRRQACLEEAASILYEETPASELQVFAAKTLKSLVSKNLLFVYGFYKYSLSFSRGYSASICLKRTGIPSSVYT